ncbi:class I SAM-dependent methyltransferase [Paenibacillus arenilitoris]|uniref:Class I SAM-dependent methyltransferase n=1 Tax=Paenibacillus arenilitoris TaxID=2772299 RepID=A0A927CHB2_9BACL|nr:class I SAM-dependent methyltransferase [Paenibacillus arenilitoris]MBD2867504.1 class I SAM-dependent methyltransferase [Paenibacillus arenilitoris]
MDSKERFSNRVETYVKYRPSYPKEAIDYLYGTVGLGKESEIADIGAGTGIFSKLLLERGSGVIAVEPNDAMRDAAERQLGGMRGFRSLRGSAEHTGLPGASVDYIVCAQAFHWFDRGAAQAEFGRILKASGKAVLVWNSRLTHGTPFLEQYDRLLRTYGTDYDKVNHKNITTASLVSFFKRGGLQEARFANRQVFGFEELAGRLQSSSYAPASGHPDYAPMMEELRRVFDRNERGGKVAVEYETEIYWGEVGKPGF